MFLFSLRSGKSKSHGSCFKFLKLMFYMPSFLPSEDRNHSLPADVLLPS